MEPNSTHGLLELLKDWWFLISAFVAFIAGYVRLKVRLDTIEKRMDKTDVRIDKVEDGLRDDLKIIRQDIKTILLKLGGGND